MCAAAWRSMPSTSAVLRPVSMTCVRPAVRGFVARSGRGRKSGIAAGGYRRDRGLRGDASDLGERRLAGAHLGQPVLDQWAHPLLDRDAPDLPRGRARDDERVMTS